MSANTMLPAIPSPPCTAAFRDLPFQPSPGLAPAAIAALRAKFPGHLSREYETLLSSACGLDATPLQYIDFTGQWHDEEPIAILRPSVTLAVDAHGRRWVAETSNPCGMPGPVWCVLPAPQVAVYVSHDIEHFLDQLRRHAGLETVEAWLHSIQLAAERAWRHRGALAFQARQECIYDRQVRQWLLQLPRDARIYDLRSASFGAAWPYGAAGPAGRFHRCGRELLFAVSGFPAPSLWSDYLGSVAERHPTPIPAIVAYDRQRHAQLAFHGRDSTPAMRRPCA